MMLVLGTTAMEDKYMGIPTSVLEPGLDLHPDLYGPDEDLEPAQSSEPY